ncbi:MAG TPA: helix-turn-helix domain-containing protein [Burkholderiaceae bacterium]|nr:helix-turn-helix domain-containing protein [Burkholderiaceae bacterium]
MASYDAPTSVRMAAFRPCLALAPYITEIYAYEIPASAQLSTPGALTLLPDGFPTMCFLYGDTLKAEHGERTWLMRSAICGFQGRPMRMSCAGFAAGLTVRFVPWGLACFMPESLEDAAHCRLDCRDVFARSAVEGLESELFDLPTLLARVRRVEAFLLARLRPQATDRLVQQVVRGILQGDGARGIRAMASDAGASERTLERRFRRAIGVPPKGFSRVTRLQSALRHREQTGSWAESAIDAGYYDQAHLIRDAQEIFGVTPQTVAAPTQNDLAQGFQSLARDTALDSQIFR